MGTNEQTLLELKLELAVLRLQPVRTPEQHRKLAERINWIGDLISLIDHVEKQ